MQHRFSTITQKVLGIHAKNLQILIPLKSFHLSYVQYRFLGCSDVAPKPYGSEKARPLFGMSCERIKIKKIIALMSYRNYSYATLIPKIIFQNIKPSPTFNHFFEVQNSGGVFQVCEEGSLLPPHHYIHILKICKILIKIK